VPTKNGVMKQYISTNLMLFQDKSFNAKKDEYKSSLFLVKKDLERRKRKYDPEHSDKSLESISHIAIRPKKSH